MRAVCFVFLALFVGFFFKEVFILGMVLGIFLDMCRVHLGRRLGSVFFSYVIFWTWIYASKVLGYEHDNITSSQAE